ncbi:uncharacterized protein I303_106124 [Kwoniella dejecticola CBS 10117]|uniref:HbrB-like protein n=1 Tax=Kwoniella dejecticola CBS 10117 TaxID=1296121 RepID=A0A1A6A1D3_9TREE|nr:uncharacterized protein I303_06143 [Kwoniella dejecticola CBS 10117]OBR83860.1 hypothetical protein I303_06143 [Kwoniella dejecticola CBS 10117]
MTSNPPTFRRPSNLSIRPPSPPSQSSSYLAQAQAQQGGPSSGYVTPTNLTNPYQNLYSPRRTALPPSPTHSNVSYASKGSSSGLGVGNRDDPLPPPLPNKNDNDRNKKLPTLPLPNQHIQGQSPHKYAVGGYGPGPGHGQKGWATGAYDNKLVSSTLSHLPPLPPLSPVPISSSSGSLHPAASSSHLHPSPRPSLSNQSSSGIVVYPDGTPLADHQNNHHHQNDLSGRIAESMTVAHTSPSSPWSLLTVHVLPLFAGSALKTPIEDLNHLCHSHIVATSQRYPPARIVSLLTADLREFIASGMLTLKAKFETLEEGKVVSRAAEVWIFFWAQVLPYVEGVFLPFTQLRDLPTSSSSSYLTALSSSIPVRHLLLSGFLLHILLPLLPRLIPLITNPPKSPIANSYPPPTTQELNKILQMSLVLSTQARYSTFFGSSSGGQDDRDEEVREHVEGLGKAVRWRLQQNEIESQLPLGENDPNSPIKNSPNKVPARSAGGLQRGPSLSQSGRYRRKGWRASANLGLLSLNQYNNDQSGTMSRQNSGDPGTLNMMKNRLAEEDEDRAYENDHDADLSLPMPPRIRTTTSDSMNLGTVNTNGGSVVSTLNGGSTVTGGSTIGVSSTMGGSSTVTGGSTIRGESLASYGEDPSASMMPTPSGGPRAVQPPPMGGEMMYGRPVRRVRAESEGSEVNANRTRGRI